MVLFFFYKNIYFGITIFLYNSLCLFSGQLIYDDFYMSLYNVIFTSLAPLAVGLLDQDVDRVSSLQFPGLYRQGQRNSCFSLGMQAVWILHGLLHAGITMVIVFLSTGISSDRKSGTTYGHWQVGVLLFSCVVVTVHIQLAVVLETWTLFHQVSIWGSIFVWFFYLMIYGALPVTWALNMHHLFLSICAPSFAFWLILFVTATTCVLPGYFIRSAYSLIVPEDHRIVQEIRQMEKKRGPQIAMRRLRRNISVEELSSLNRCGRRSSLNRGYVPGDAPGSVSYFTPKSTLEQIEYEAQGVSRHPVVAKLEKELSLNPYRHRETVCNSEHLDTGSQEDIHGDVTTQEVQCDAASLGRFQSLQIESFKSAEEYELLEVNK